MAIPNRQPYLHLYVTTTTFDANSAELGYTHPTPLPVHAPRSLFSSSSYHPKRPVTPHRIPNADRRDPPDSLDAHRRHLGLHSTRTARLGVHGGQSTIRFPRMEARDVRSPRTLAWRASRMDQR
jgi:hypothetical protein